MTFEKRWKESNDLEHIWYSSKEKTNAVDQRNTSEDGESQPRIFKKSPNFRHRDRPTVGKISTGSPAAPEKNPRAEELVQIWSARLSLSAAPPWPASNRRPSVA